MVIMVMEMMVMVMEIMVMVLMMDWMEVVLN